MMEEATYTGEEYLRTTAKFLIDQTALAERNRRDMLAAQAMLGLIHIYGDYDMLAAKSVVLADTMIKALDA